MLTVRKATQQDAEYIHSLAEIVFPATYREILSPEQLDYMMDWMYAPDSIRQQMDKGHVFMIASIDGTDCGYASVEQQAIDLFHLQKLYVLPAFQGRHIGQFLFNEAVRYIQSVHAEPCVMELNVNRTNKAFHFYQRMGMTVAAEGDFPIGNGYYMNDYIMALKIG
ncbi:MAG: GNAT family N-acetyltransferase [Tannerella sp.]|jgi:ribosomal protein S18 acetylase RimI-like enzyme|nr:GNAT family N-acetyltransferase [Tannerella sp.]